LPLFERKASRKNAQTEVQFSEGFAVDGREMYKHACEASLSRLV
jgi:bifunctional non-homologous end joining protein LigD